MATVASPNSEDIDVTMAGGLADAPHARHRGAAHTLASQILLNSFIAAVLLAIAGFVVVAVYLFLYLHHAFSAFDTNAVTQFAAMDPTRMQPILLARAGLWKFILQSCWIISGVAFGFLGFALFLLGVKGDMDASFADSAHKVQLSRMAPGSFVILIAAILVGICSINKVELSFTPVISKTETVIPVPVPAQSNSNNDRGFDPSGLLDKPSAPTQNSSGKSSGPAPQTPGSQAK